MKGYYSEMNEEATASCVMDLVCSNIWAIYYTKDKKAEVESLFKTLRIRPTREVRLLTKEEWRTPQGFTSNEFYHTTITTKSADKLIKSDTKLFDMHLLLD